ncbi:MAG: hypothetical protein KIS79_13820, partial [Burkholderiales bacterium]|nr:hypothetical protein [Burkholderiales bacterium]
MRTAWRLCLSVLTLLTLLHSASARDTAPLHVEHDISVDLDPHTRQLRVEDNVMLRGQGRVEITLSARYHVEHASIDGRALSRSGVRDDLHTYEVMLSGEADQRLHLQYSGRLAALTHTDHRGTLQGLQPMAGEAGSYLPAGTGWYPQVGDALMRYRLALRLPAGQRGLVPGRLLEESETDGSYRARYAFAQPAEGIDLMAGPYIVQSRAIDVGGKRVHLRTWFH